MNDTVLAARLRVISRAYQRTLEEIVLRYRISDTEMNSIYEESIKSPRSFLDMLRDYGKKKMGGNDAP